MKPSRASPLLDSPFSSKGADLKMKKRVAVVGSGFMASEYFRVLTAIPSVDVVGIFSRNQRTSKELVNGHREVYLASSIEDLYRTVEPDGVVIAVSEMSTSPVLKEVFKYNWISLVEKPIGIDIKLAIELAEMSISMQHSSFAALNRRYFSSTNYLMEKLAPIEQSPRFVRIIDQEDLIKAAQIGTPEMVLRNWMHANSVHLIDYFSQLCRGEVDEVSTSRLDLESNRFVIESNLTFSSGDFGRYICYWNMPASWSVNINVQDYEFELKPLEFLRQRRLPDLQWEDSEINQVDKDFKTGLFRMCEDFVFALKGEPHSLQDLHQSLSTRFLIDRIYKGILL